MSERLRFTAVYEPTDEGWIAARVLEIPGVNTQGRTIEEAREMVRDALLLVLEHRRGPGELSELPEGTVTEPVEILVA